MTHEEEVIELLKTGNFTIAYHDNGSCCLYKGKFKYDDLPEAEDYSFDMDDNYVGYAPSIVHFLASALGGKCDSI